MTIKMALQTKFKKNDPNFDFRKHLFDVINNNDTFDSWLKYKNNFIKNNNLPPSIKNSARSNVDIFMKWRAEN